MSSIKGGDCERVDRLSPLPFLGMASPLFENVSSIIGAICIGRLSKSLCFRELCLSDRCSLLCVITTGLVLLEEEFLIVDTTCPKGFSTPDDGMLPTGRMLTLVPARQG